MKKRYLWAVLVFCTASLAAQAQSGRKPGLYDVTTTMTMTGMPSNMPGSGSHSSQVCVTQAMIDKYGSPYSNPQGNCQTTNTVVTPTGMTANVTCSGKTNVTGTVQATFVDANTTKTTMHLTMSAPGGGQSMSMTTESTYSFKGSDCGSVKPLQVPASN